MSDAAAPTAVGLPWIHESDQPAAPDRLTRLADDILARCRGEGPANCVARCPLHVDARGYVQLAKAGRYGLGVVISASHNPAPDNGVKLFTGTGRKADPGFESAVENRMAESPGPDLDVEPGSYGFREDAADAYIDTEAVRLTAWQAAWRLAAGLDASKQVATAKFFAAESGKRVVHAAQHLHGGIGVDREYPLHRFFVYARHLELTLGGGTQHLLKLGRLIAAE